MSRWDDAEAEFYGKVIPAFLDKHVQGEPAMTEEHTRRLRGLLESVKLQQHDGRHLTIHRDELAPLADALVAALRDRRA